MCKVMITVTGPDGDIQRVGVTLNEPSEVLTLQFDGVGVSETVHLTGQGEHLDHRVAIHPLSAGACPLSAGVHRVHRHLRVVRRPA